MSDSLVSHRAGTPDQAVLKKPENARGRLVRLVERKAMLERRSTTLAGEFAEINRFLDLAPAVTAALDQLGSQLFQELLHVVCEKLTIALQEILEQPLELVAEPGTRGGAATVKFSIKRNGESEDILNGQGGSVANILSVGLRMFALASLDEAKHRRFLVLDEQDCWLRPDLVPRLVKIVADAGRALGYQVLMISHHDPAVFDRFADKIYRFQPEPEGRVRVEAVAPNVLEPDVG
jgi:hypothetical protein